MGAYGCSIWAVQGPVPACCAPVCSCHSTCSRCQPCHVAALLLCPRLQLKAASRQATVSTASMGKFDRLARGEKKEDRAAARGKKRKFLPTADKVGGRRQHLRLALISRLAPHVRREQAS